MNALNWNEGSINPRSTEKLCYSWFYD